MKITPAQTTQAFLRLHEVTAVKLQAGADKRREIFRALRRGETPTGPREAWLRATAMELLGTLEIAGVEFNAVNAGDRVSVQDMLDALATAADLLRGA